MVLVKTFFGTVILLIGIVITLIGITIFDDPPTAGEVSNVDTAIFMVVIGTMPLIFGLWLLKNARDQSRHDKKGNLETVFYEMLKNGETTIADFDFDVQNKITRQHAREFLEKKCTELGASTDADDRGMVTYTFGG